MIIIIIIIIIIITIIVIVINMLLTVRRAPRDPSGGGVQALETREGARQALLSFYRGPPALAPALVYGKPCCSFATSASVASLL